MSETVLQTVLGQEIAEQPELLARLLAAPMGLTATQAPSASVRFLLGIAEGSSRHALEIAAPFLEAWTGLPMRVWDPQTLHNALDCIERYPSQSPSSGSLAQTFCLAVSQSGQTASLLQGLERLTTVFEPQGLACPAILAVTNHIESTLAKRFGPALWINASPEKSIAATKTLTATLLMLLRWGLEAGCQLNRVSAQQRTQIEADLSRIPSLLQALCLTKQHEAFSAFCHRLTPQHAPVQHFILLGKGLLTLVLPEAGLKLTETSRNIVYTQNSESFKHGPKVMLAGLNAQHPNALYIVPPDPRDAMGLFDDAQAHFWSKGKSLNTNLPQFPTDRIFWVRFANSPGLPVSFTNTLVPDASHVLTLPAVDSPLQAIFSILVTFQWVSALLAEQRAVLPDDPALSKAVE